MFLSIPDLTLVTGKAGGEAARPKPRTVPQTMENLRPPKAQRHKIIMKKNINQSFESDVMLWSVYLLRFPK